MTFILPPSRHYGALQGLDKQETVAKYGKDQVNVWYDAHALQQSLLNVQRSAHGTLTLNSV
jgi:bisphosphoglycerate-dependent phosphoglycerate mutase